MRMTESEQVLTYRLAQAEAEIRELREKVTQMERDAETRERARLKAGIGALGTVVLTLFGVLWGYRSVIFK